MEYLDILDEHGNKTGKSKSYDEAHEKGLIHRAVHVWVLNSQGKILIQKRSKDKQAHPGLWDISAAGHISAGQTSLEAAQREVLEELGVEISESKFHLLFEKESHSILNNGTYVNNEFQDIYLVETDLAEADIKLEKEGEVEAVKFLSINEFKKWIRGDGEAMVPHEEEYRRLLEHIDKI